MALSCPFIQPISGTECIGDSREKINSNFQILQTAVCSLTAKNVGNAEGVFFKEKDDEEFVYRTMKENDSVLIITETNTVILSVNPEFLLSDHAVVAMQMFSGPTYGRIY